MCVIDTLCDLLQEIGPGSVVFKAPSVLLMHLLQGDTWSWCCEVAEFILVLGQCPTEQAGHIHVEGFRFGSSMVPQGL